jgi:hypothetical protein
VLRVEAELLFSDGRGGGGEGRVGDVSGVLLFLGRSCWRGGSRSYASSASSSAVLLYFSSSSWLHVGGNLCRRWITHGVRLAKSGASLRRFAAACSVAPSGS